MVLYNQLSIQPYYCGILSHLKGFVIGLLFMDPDESQTEQEDQTEDDQQQGEAPHRQIQLVIPEHQHSTKRNSTDHQSEHRERHHLAWLTVSQYPSQIRLPASLQCAWSPSLLHRLLPLHQLKFIREGLILLQLSAVLRKGLGLIRHRRWIHLLSWLVHRRCGWSICLDSTSYWAPTAFIWLKAEHYDAGRYKSVSKQSANREELDQCFQIKDEGKDCHKAAKNKNCDHRDFGYRVDTRKDREEEAILRHGIHDPREREEVAEQHSVHG